MIRGWPASVSQPDMNDRSVFGFGEEQEKGLRTTERAFEHSLKRLISIAVRGWIEIGQHVDPRIVDQQRDRSQRPAGLFGRGVDGRTIRDIHLQRNGKASVLFDLAGDLMSVVGAFAIGERDVRADFGQAQRDRAPDATASSGHDRVAAMQREAFHAARWAFARVVT